jgi:hypothetical protein
MQRFQQNRSLTFSPLNPALRSIDALGNNSRRSSGF